MCAVDGRLQRGPVSVAGDGSAGDGVDLSALRGDGLLLQDRYGVPVDLLVPEIAVGHLERVDVCDLSVGDGDADLDRAPAGLRHRAVEGAARTTPRVVGGAA